MAAQSELRVDELLQRADSQLIQTGALGLREALGGKLRQQRLLLGTPNRDTMLFIENFERSKDAEFHASAGPLLAQTYPPALSCANGRSPRCYRAAAAQ